MVLAAVRSSQIKAIGYDAATETLAIEFHAKTKRSVYTYANVGPHLAAFVIFAESVGKAFGERIKSNEESYPFTRVLDPAPFTFEAESEPGWLVDLRDHVAAESEAQ